MANTAVKKKRRARRKLDPAWVSITPAAVSDLAYSHYVYSKAKANGYHEDELDPIVAKAKWTVDAFDALLKRTIEGTPEWVFAMAVNRIMVSLSSGILRRKQTFHEGKAAAKEAKDEHKRIVASAAKQALVFQLSVKSLLLGLAGTLLSQFILPMIKQGDLTHQGMASIATGLGVALASDYLKRWIVQIRLLGIDAKYSEAVNFALRLYRASSLEEYTRADQCASEAYERYTGKKPPQQLDVGDITENEIKMCEEMDAVQRLATLGRAILWLDGATKAIRRGKRKGTAPQPESTQPNT